MKTIDPTSISTKELYQYLIGSIAPRPIALVSTMDTKGNANLAPYSFFNVFSYNPPILVFSTTLTGNNADTKHTLDNVKESKELVINVVAYDMIRQMIISSVQYPKGISEFEKAGFTPLPATKIKPYRVAQSPIQYECEVQQIIPLGDQQGAGNLVICKVVNIHLSEEVLDEGGKINPHKIDLVGRLGQKNYVRASGEAVYSMPIPSSQTVVGYDKLPDSAKKSTILTANDLGHLASLIEIPTQEAIEEIRNDARVVSIIRQENKLEELHLFAQKELAKENLSIAAATIWLADYLITA